MRKKDIILDELINLKNISAMFNNLYIEEIQQIEEMILENTFKVAVIGGFSVGKTTFLNALIGRRLLYSSSKEATGTVTFIQNSRKKLGVIEFSDKSSVELDLNSDNAYKSLEIYLDKNSDKTAKNVNIQYPIDGAIDDVVFIDTPGLEGVDEKELNITKQIMKEVNATIFVIKHNGLVKDDLELLCGKLKSFGRIRTKEIFVVINKIGELRDIKDESTYKESVDRVIEDVKNKLIENGMGDIKVFALDSKDYLWSQDKELYNEVSEFYKDSSVKKILSQDEYKKRSDGFINFKNFLFDFLGADNRNKAFYEDIEEKIGILVEEFTSELQLMNKQKNNYVNDKIVNLINQKDFILENRRKINNKIKRQLSSCSQNFKESLEKDNKNFIKSDREKIINYINDNLQSIEECNDSQTLKMLKIIEKNIKSDKEFFNVKLKEFYSSIENILSDFFELEFSKGINGFRKLKLTIAFDKHDIDFKFKEPANKRKYLDDLNEERYDLEKQIRILQDKINCSENYNKKISDIEKAIKKAYGEEKMAKKRLGERPNPVQKYRTVERTRRKLLFFKETYYEKVPDGLDFTECERWDKKNNDITIKYEKILENLYKKLRSSKKKKLCIDSTEKELKYKKNQLKEVESLIVEFEKIQEEKRKKSQEIFVDKKKSELLNLGEQALNKNNKKLINSIELYMTETDEKISNQIDIQIAKYMDEISKDIEDKIESMKNELKNCIIDNNMAVKNFEKLQKKYVGKV